MTSAAPITPDYNDNAKEMRIHCNVGDHKIVTAGPAYIVKPYIPAEPSTKPIPAKDIEKEIAKLEAAFEALRERNAEQVKHITEIIAALPEGSANAEKSIKDILETETIMLQDGSGTTEMKDRIRGVKITKAINPKTGKKTDTVETPTPPLSAKRVIHEAMNKFVSIYKGHDDPEMLRTAQTFEDFRVNFLTLLDGEKLTSLKEIPKDSILITDEVQPAEVTHLITLGQARIPAMVAKELLPGSHAYITCKAAGIMTVSLQNEEDLKYITTHTPIIIDGHKGTIIVNPNEDTVKRYQSQIDKQNLHKALLNARSLKTKTPQTTDGEKITLKINAEFPTEVARIHETGPHKEIEGFYVNASGVGLFRTDMEFLETYKEMPAKKDSTAWKEWEKHTETIWGGNFESAVKAAGTKPIKFRAVDTFGDKGIKDENGNKKKLPEHEEEEVYRIQIRELLKAKKKYPDSNPEFMIPNVRGASHFGKYQKIMKEEAGALNIAPLPLEAMGEIIGFLLSAGIADAKLKGLSIGSNDLLANLTAFDREDPNTTEFYDPTTRGFINLLIDTIKKCQGIDCNVSLCGDIASDPRYTALLIGVGLKELSVGLAEIPEIKEMISRIDSKLAENMVEELRDEPSREKREKILDDFNEKIGYTPKTGIKITPNNDEERKILNVKTTAEPA